MGVAGIQAGEDRGGNILGIPRVPQTCKKSAEEVPCIADIPPTGHASLIEWTDPKDDTVAHKLVQSFGTGVEEFARVRSNFYAYRFMNDASYAQSPLDSYGSGSWAKMRAVSSKYDPAGVFQRLQNAGFLLSRTHVD